MLETSGKTSKLVKGLARNKKTWFKIDNISNSFSEKHKLWKDEKQGHTNKISKDLEAKLRTRKAIYQDKCNTEKVRFGYVM